MQKNSMKFWQINALRIAILVIGIALCAAGIYREELTEIMRKATVICLECIGIG